MMSKKNRREAEETTRQLILSYRKMTASTKELIEAINRTEKTVKEFAERNNHYFDSSERMVVQAGDLCDQLAEKMAPLKVVKPRRGIDG